MEKKRDRKGRILRNGERQREDGRYEFRYLGLRGEAHSVYSWRLIDTDPTPPGKRSCEPLRNIEKKIEEQKLNGIDLGKAQTMTLDEAFEVYMSLHPKWKPSTRHNKTMAYNTYVKPTFGKRHVSDIRQSQIKQHYIDMQQKNGLSFGTVKGAHAVLYSIMEQLVQDDVIRKNPAQRALEGVEINSREKKRALTLAQQNKLVEFMESTIRYMYWKPLITFLLGTGARIGEACALRWRNVDFEAGVIHIQDNLIRYKDDDVYVYEYTTPKSDAGERDIPMFADVKDALWSRYCFTTLRKRRPNVDNELVFATKFDAALKPNYAEKIIHEIRDECNLTESLLAEKEGREPILLPDMTPHTLRHTFCTRLCEQGVNVKIVQTVMGHSDIKTTMDVYADVDKAVVQTSFGEIEGKIKMA